MKCEKIEKLVSELIKQVTDIKDEKVYKLVTGILELRREEVESSNPWAAYDALTIIGGGHDKEALKKIFSHIGNAKYGVKFKITCSGDYGDLESLHKELSKYMIEGL